MQSSENHLEYKWYAGYTDEFFNVGPCDSREEIIEEGRSNYDDDGFYIIQAKKAPLQLSSYVDIDLMMENADESASDMSNEDGDSVFELSTAQMKSLSECVSNALDNWQQSNGIRFMPHVFTDVCNEEYIKGSSDE